MAVFKLLASVIRQNYSEPHAQRTCEANPADENSSFIFTVCIKSVSFYVKLGYIVLYALCRSKNILEPTKEKMEKYAVSLRVIFDQPLK